jgi:hypothetical protein
MAAGPDISFVALEPPQAGSAVLLTDKDLRLGPVAARLEAAAGGTLRRAALAAKFQGKLHTTL